MRYMSAIEPPLMHVTELVDPLADALHASAGRTRRGERGAADPTPPPDTLPRPAPTGWRTARGSAIDARQHPRAVDVAVVAAEQLVAAVAAERDGDVPARQLRDEQGRQLRRIGERLVEDLGEPRDERRARRRRVSRSSV